MPLLTPHVPNGLIDLMKDLAKEVLREKPQNIQEFAVIHFEKLILQRDGSLDNGYEEFTAFAARFDGQQRFALPANCGYICQKPIKIQPIHQSRKSKSDIMAGFQAMESIDEEDALAPTPKGTSLYADEKYQNAIYVIQRYFRRYVARKKKQTIKNNKSLSAFTAAIIIQRTMRRLFSNKIKLKKDKDSGPSSVSAVKLAQDDMDNVSEAASYTSSSTIQMLADGQEGRENRLASGQIRRQTEEVSDGYADGDGDVGAADYGSMEFKEPASTQDEEPPSSSSSATPTATSTSTALVADDDEEHSHSVVVATATSTDMDRKSIADENEITETNNDETPNQHSASTTDVIHDYFHKQDTSTAHNIGILSTKIGSNYNHQNHQNLPNTNNDIESDRNIRKPIQTNTGQLLVSHIIPAGLSVPLNYPHSQIIIEATPDTLPAITSHPPSKETQEIFAQNRLEEYANENAKNNDASSSYFQADGRIRKFDSGTGESLKMYDVYYHDMNDQEFSDSLNESTMEKDSLEPEELDADSLESNENMVHNHYQMSDIVKRDAIYQDDGSLYDEDNNNDDENGDHHQETNDQDDNDNLQNVQKFNELERVPTYLYGIHPARTPVVERRNRNRNSEVGHKVPEDKKYLDSRNADEKSEETSLESKGSTSEESSATQIENYLEVNRVKGEELIGNCETKPTNSPELSAMNLYPNEKTNHKVNEDNQSIKTTLNQESDITQLEGKETKELTDEDSMKQHESKLSGNGKHDDTSRNDDTNPEKVNKLHEESNQNPTILEKEINHVRHELVVPERLNENLKSNDVEVSSIHSDNPDSKPGVSIQSKKEKSLQQGSQNLNSSSVNKLSPLVDEALQIGRSDLKNGEDLVSKFEVDNSSKESKLDKNPTEVVNTESLEKDIQLSTIDGEIMKQDNQPEHGLECSDESIQQISQTSNDPVLIKDETRKSLPSITTNKSETTQQCKEDSSLKIMRENSENISSTSAVSKTNLNLKNSADQESEPLDHDQEIEAQINELKHLNELHDNHKAASDLEINGDSLASKVDHKNNIDNSDKSQESMVQDVKKVPKLSTERNLSLEEVLVGCKVLEKEDLTINLSENSELLKEKPQTIKQKPTEISKNDRLETEFRENHCVDSEEINELSANSKLLKEKPQTIKKEPTEISKDDSLENEFGESHSVDSEETKELSANESNNKLEKDFKIEENNSNEALNFNDKDTHRQKETLLHVEDSAHPSVKEGEDSQVSAEEENVTNLNTDKLKDQEKVAKVNQKENKTAVAPSVASENYELQGEDQLKEETKSSKKEEINESESKAVKKENEENTNQDQLPSEDKSVKEAEHKIEEINKNNESEEKDFNLKTCETSKFDKAKKVDVESETGTHLQADILDIKEEEAPKVTLNTEDSLENLELSEHKKEQFDSNHQQNESSDKFEGILSKYDKETLEKIESPEFKEAAEAIVSTDNFEISEDVNLTKKRPKRSSNENLEYQLSEKLQTEEKKSAQDSSNNISNIDESQQKPNVIQENEKTIEKSERIKNDIKDKDIESSNQNNPNEHKEPDPEHLIPLTSPDIIGYDGSSAETSADISSIGKDLEFFEDTIQYLKNATEHLGGMPDAFDTKKNLIEDFGILSHSAVLIQSAFRGYRIRKNLKELERKREVDKCKQTDSKVYNEDKINAALKIQSAYRGYQVRKDLKNRKETEIQKQENESSSFCESQNNIEQPTKNVLRNNQEKSQIPVAVIHPTKYLSSTKEGSLQQTSADNSPSKQIKNGSSSSVKEPINKNLKTSPSLSQRKQIEMKSNVKNETLEEIKEEPSITRKTSIDKKDQTFIRDSLDQTVKMDQTQILRNKKLVNAAIGNKSSHLKIKTKSTANLIEGVKGSRNVRDQFARTGKSVSINGRSQNLESFDLEMIKKELLSSPPQSASKKKTKFRVRSGKNRSPVKQVRATKIPQKSSSKTINSTKSEEKNSQCLDQVEQKNQDDLSKTFTVGVDETSENLQSGNKEPDHSQMKPTLNKTHTIMSSLNEAGHLDSQLEKNNEVSENIVQNLEDHTDTQAPSVEEKSAVTIQKTFRGYRTRKNLKKGSTGNLETISSTEEKELETLHSKKDGQIFSETSDNNAKEECVNLVEDKDNKVSMPIEEISEPNVVEAALKIQKVYRGYMTRKNYKSMKGNESKLGKSPYIVDTDSNNFKDEPTKVLDEDDRVSNKNEEKAALTIQKTFRGYRSRKQHTKPKIDKINEEASVDSKVEKDTSDQESNKSNIEKFGENSGIFEDIQKSFEDYKNLVLDKSATTIQKHYRGYRVRKDSILKGVKEAISKETNANLNHDKNEPNDKLAAQKDNAKDEDDIKKEERQQVPEKLEESNVNKSLSKAETEPSSIENEFKNKISHDSQGSLKDLNKSATIIQKNFRGYRTRKQLKQDAIENKNNSNNEKQKQGVFDSFDVEEFHNAALEKSATIIQKTFRGYKTRKDIQKNKQILKESKKEEAQELSKTEENIIPHLIIHQIEGSNANGKSNESGDKTKETFEKGTDVEEKSLPEEFTNDLKSKEEASLIDASTSVPSNFDELNRTETSFKEKVEIESNDTKYHDLTQQSDKDHSSTTGKSANDPQNILYISQLEKVNDLTKSANVINETEIHRDKNIDIDKEDSVKKTDGDNKSTNEEPTNTSKQTDISSDITPLQEELKSTQNSVAIKHETVMNSEKITNSSEDFISKHEESQVTQKNIDISSTAVPSQHEPNSAGFEKIGKSEVHRNLHETINTENLDRVQLSAESQSSASNKSTASPREGTITSMEEDLLKNHKSKPFSAKQTPKSSSAEAVLENAASIIQKAYRDYQEYKTNPHRKSYSNGTHREATPKETIENSDESSAFIGPDTSFDLSDVESVENKSEKTFIEDKIHSSELQTPTNGSEEGIASTFTINVHSDGQDIDNEGADTPQKLRIRRNLIEPTAPPLDDDEIRKAEDAIETSSPKLKWFVGDEPIIPSGSNSSKSSTPPPLPISSSSSSLICTSSKLNNLSSVDAYGGNLNSSQQLTPSISSAVVSTSSLLLTNNPVTNDKHSLNKNSETVSANEEENVMKEKINQNEEISKKSENEDEIASNIVKYSSEEELKSTEAENGKNQDHTTETPKELCKNCAEGIHEDGICLEDSIKTTKKIGSEFDPSDQIKQFVLMEEQSSNGDDESSNGMPSIPSFELDSTNVTRIDPNSQISQKPEQLNASKDCPSISLIPPSSEDDTSGKESSPAIKTTSNDQVVQNNDPNQDKNSDQIKTEAVEDSHKSLEGLKEEDNEDTEAETESIDVDTVKPIDIKHDDHVSLELKSEEKPNTEETEKESTKSNSNSKEDEELDDHVVEDPNLNPKSEGFSSNIGDEVNSSSSPEKTLEDAFQTRPGEQLKAEQQVFEDDFSDSKNIGEATGKNQIVTEEEGDGNATLNNVKGSPSKVKRTESDKAEDTESHELIQKPRDHETNQGTDTTKSSENKTTEEIQIPSSLKQTTQQEVTEENTKHHDSKTTEVKSSKEDESDFNLESEEKKSIDYSPRKDKDFGELQEDLEIAAKLIESSRSDPQAKLLEDENRDKLANKKNSNESSQINKEQEEAIPQVEASLEKLIDENLKPNDDIKNTVDVEDLPTTNSSQEVVEEPCVKKATLNKLIDEDLKPGEEVKNTDDNVEDLPTENSAQEVVEEPCVKKLIPPKPHSATNSDPDESELESTATKAESTTTTPGYDETSETDVADLTPSKPDALDAMAEKLREPEEMVARMRQRRASEHKLSMDSVTDQLANFEDPICEPIKPMQKIQKSSSTEAEDEFVLQKLQRGDTTRESSAQSESVVFGDSTSQLAESEDTFNENLELHSLHRMKTIAPNQSGFKHPNHLFKSVTIDDTVKYIDPEISTEESGSSFCMDDALSEDVRKKMMAYSVSEADSDYYDVGEQPSNPHDDFNISTALDNFPSTDTDTTIVSAATKIQAGARGFLTRRRIRRASMGTKPSLNEHNLSFGNDAIGESLDQLAEEEVGRRQFNRQTGVNSLPSALEHSDEMLSPRSKNTQIMTLALDKHSAIEIEGKVANKVATTSTENDVNKWLEKPSKDDSSQVVSNLEATVARRLTLQRGDAMRNDSTPDEENGNGKQVDLAKNSPSSMGSVLVHEEKTTVKSSTTTTTSTRTITERRNYSDAATLKKKDKIKWFALRQNSMPVQIDSEVFRVLPKHMRKRIKSAEGEKPKRIRLPRD